MESGKPRQREVLELPVTVRVTFTDANGKTIFAETQLGGGAGFVDLPVPRRPSGKTGSPAEAVDLNVPLRAFLSKHARGRSGPAKFTLLLAQLAKGRVDAAVEFTALTEAWNRATGHLGKFNPAHTTRAKDKGWVDSPKQGVYVLCEGWTEVLAERSR